MAFKNNIRAEDYNWMDVALAYRQQFENSCALPRHHRLTGMLKEQGGMTEKIGPIYVLANPVILRQYVRYWRSGATKSSVLGTHA